MHEGTALLSNSNQRWVMGSCLKDLEWIYIYIDYIFRYLPTPGTWLRGLLLIPRTSRVPGIFRHVFQAERATRLTRGHCTGVSN